MPSFLNTFSELIIALIAGAILGSVGTGLYKNSQHKAEMLEQAAEYTAILNEAQEAKEAAEAKAIAQNELWQLKFSEADHSWTQQLQEGNAKREKEINALRTGVKRLRVSTVNPACSRSKVPGVATSASGSDDQTTSYLSGPVAEQLVRSASLADEVVHQLDMCQNILVIERTPVK